MTRLSERVSPKLITWLRLTTASVGETMTHAAFLGVWAVVLVLAVAASIVNARDFQVRRERYLQRLQLQTRLQLQARPLMGWQVEESLRANRPPELGSMLVRGGERSLPAYVDFAPDGAMWGSEPAAVSHASVGPRMDLAWLALNPIALVAMLVGAHRVVLARHRGTWRVLTDLGTPWRVVVTAELAAGLLSVAALWLTSLLMAGATIAWLEASPGNLRNVINILLLLVLPGLGFFALAVGSAALAASWLAGRTSAYLAAVGAWAAMAALLPHVAPAVVSFAVGAGDRSLMEAERRSAFNMAIRDAEETLGDRVAKLSHESGAALEIALEASRDELEVDWSTGAADARQAALDVEDEWVSRFQRESRWTSIAGVVSPASVASWLFAELAGTGQRLQEGWIGQTNAHQTKLNAALFDDRPRVTIRPPSGQGRELHGLDRRRPPKLSELPVLPAVQPSVLPRVGLPLLLGLVLAAYAVIAWSLAVLSARRLP